MNKLGDTCHCNVSKGDDRNAREHTGVDKEDMAGIQL